MTLEDAARAAYWEFSGRIVTPSVERLIPDKSKAHAVAIGYEAGSTLCAAADFFGKVTGVSTSADDDEPQARENLQACGLSDIELLNSENVASLPLADSSVDLVYSLRGIVRLADLNEFEQVVAESARVLKPGGLAFLWFGRMSRLPLMPPSGDWWRGWAKRSPASAPGEEWLHLRMYHARRAALRAGMRTVALSTPLHPDTSWRLFRGGEMSFITAWKPDR